MISAIGPPNLPGVILWECDPQSGFWLVSAGYTSATLEVRAACRLRRGGPSLIEFIEEALR